jgi:hypothetical protein
MSEFRIMQDGMPVAWSDNERDAMHYALVYSADGKVEMQQKHNGRWKRAWTMERGGE